MFKFDVIKLQHWQITTPVTVTMNRERIDTQKKSFVFVIQFPERLSHNTKASWGKLLWMLPDELTSGWEMLSGPNESLLLSQSTSMQITDDHWAAVPPGAEFVNDKTAQLFVAALQVELVDSSDLLNS